MYESDFNQSQNPKGRKWPIVILTIVVAMFLLVGGFFLYRSANSNKETKMSSNTQSTGISGEFSSDMQKVDSDLKALETDVNNADKGLNDQETDLSD